MTTTHLIATVVSIQADLIIGRFDGNELNYTPLCQIDNRRGDSVNPRLASFSRPILRFPAAAGRYMENAPTSMTHPRCDLIQKGIPAEGRLRSSGQFVQRIKSERRDTREIPDSPTRVTFIHLHSLPRSDLHIVERKCVTIEGVSALERPISHD